MNIKKKRSELIGLSEPYLNGNEWSYIKECLDSTWISSAGKYVNLFEAKIAEYTNAKYAVFLKLINALDDIQENTRVNS